MLREHKPQVLEDLPGADTGPRMVAQTSNGDKEQTNGVTEDDVNTNGTEDSSENSTESNGNNPEDSAESTPPQEVSKENNENQKIAVGQN